MLFAMTIHGQMTLAGQSKAASWDTARPSAGSRVEYISLEWFGPSHAPTESEYNYMQWIDEMFVNMENDRANASTNRSEKAKVAGTQHPKKQVPATLAAWNALVSCITKDVNEFNNHKERAGQTPARISQRHFQCEVHRLECEARAWS